MKINAVAYAEPEWERPFYHVRHRQSLTRVWLVEDEEKPKFCKLSLLTVSPIDKYAGGAPARKIVVR